MKPEDKKHKSNKRLLQLSALMSALGAGSYAFGKGFDSPEIREAFSNFRNFDTRLPNNAIKGYTTFGSELMNLPIMYGALSPVDLMKSLRTFPIATAAVASGLMNAGDATWTPGNFEHYKNFQQGPLHGMAKLIEEHANPSVDHIPSLALMSTKDKNLDNIRDALNTFVLEKTQIPNYFNRAFNQEPDKGKPTSLNITRYFDQPKIDKKIQAQLAMEFPSWVEARKEYTPTQKIMHLANNTAKAYKQRYSKDVLDMFENLSNKTKLIGAGLGAAGLGLGAYGLYKHLKNKKKEKDTQEKVEQE
jgi:hypothetical protein